MGAGLSTEMRDEQEKKTRDRTKPPEGPRHSYTGGDTLMSIEGRMAHERERLSGMTPEERAWRKQWLKDQMLSEREPLYISKDNIRYLNPLRRAYRWPLDQMFLAVQPKLGNQAAAAFLRYFIGRSTLVALTAFTALYYLKYHTNDWETTSGWKCTSSRAATHPDDDSYGQGYIKTQPRQYFEHGFLSSTFGKKWDNSHKVFDDEGWAPPRHPFSHTYLRPQAQEEEDRVWAEHRAAKEAQGVKAVPL